MFNPILIFLLIALFLTIIIVRFNKYMCPGPSPVEPFKNVPADVKTCPYGSTQYIDEHDNILCCDGKVEGRSCMGTDMCRFSPETNTATVPHCADYVASQSFKPSSSMIQNPATDTCMTPDPTNKIIMSPCDASNRTQLWTYNTLGQFVNDSTGKCATLDSTVPGIKSYVLKECQLADAQIFKYDYKTNQLYNVSLPLYVQDSPFEKSKKFIIGSLKDDVIRGEYKAASGRDMSPAEFNQFKTLVYSNRDRVDRGTLLAVKPSFQDTLKNITSIFKA